MTVLKETYKLENGVQIPKLGFGTWLIDNDRVATAVEKALAAGYRHIDTAQAYGNEKGIGKALHQTSVPREQIFVTTKLAAEIKSYDAALQAIDQSLKDLDLDYVDLMLIHSPQPWAQFRNGEHYFSGNLDAWRALETAYDAGKIRALGVANFEQEDLDNILTNGRIKPVVNQILLHISNTPQKLLHYCEKQHLLVEAYSPIAHGQILQNQAIQQLAAKYHVSVSQLAIRYCLELGTLPLPKSENPAHIVENSQVDFQISPEDLKTLTELPQIDNYGTASDFPVFSGK